MDHLRGAGFAVEIEDVDDLNAIKEAHGVPKGIASCHTATVAGYVIEGHVPMREVKRLLTDRPPIAGLAVPGMPVGSPGMEGPNPEPYQVLAFDGEGRVQVVASYTP